MPPKCLETGPSVNAGIGGIYSSSLGKRFLQSGYLILQILLQTLEYLRIKVIECLVLVAMVDIVTQGRDQHRRQHNVTLLT